MKYVVYFYRNALCMTIVIQAGALHADGFLMRQEETLEARHDLGRRICELRDGQKMSQHTLALMIGMNKDTISGIECGKKSPRFDSILKIADGLGVSPSDLVGEIGSPDYFARLRDAAAREARPRPGDDRGPEDGSARYYSTKL